MPMHQEDIRLDLIQIAKHCLSTGLTTEDSEQMRDLIEALRRHSELDVQTCLSPPRKEILQRVAGDEYRYWTCKYLIDG